MPSKKPRKLADEGVTSTLLPLQSRYNGDVKRCTKCLNERPIEHFYPTKRRGKEGRDARCKFCQVAAALAWRAANHPLRNPALVSASNRRAWMKKKYGLTEESYLALLATQLGKCAICGSSDPGKSGRRAGHPAALRAPVFHVDHDHVTGKVRGLLCQGCNVGIGLLRDDPRLLAAAAAYLSRQ